jgi:hypothetical protein
MRRTSRILLAFAMALTVMLAARPAGAQVTERLRSVFARAETIFRTAEPELAIEPLTQVIGSLLPDAEVGGLDTEARALLIRSLAYRADARLSNGERSAADEDLQLLLTLYPRVGIDGFGLSETALDRFERAQASLVGTLTFAPAPFNARLRVDGEDLPPDTTTYRVLAGTHYVEAFLPGFTRHAQEVEVRADRSTEVSFLLDRVSAVIKLMTRPAGATVIVDGRVVGQTAGVAPRDWTPTGDLSRYPRQEFSGEMEIEGLMPGQHEVEVLLYGYRPFSAPLEIPDLADYEVGAVVLDRNVGMVLLRDLPPDADVWVNGSRTRPEPPSRGTGESELVSTAHRLSLAPGEYRITVSQGDAGVFEETVTVADRRNLAVEISLRPGLTFLGVAGADRLGAESLQSSLRSAFAELDYWAFLDRADEAVPVLERTGATGPRLRAAAAEDEAGTGTNSSVDWSLLQATTSRELPGSVFVLAVLDDDELAAGADLWVWPAAPGPAAAERVRVSLTDVVGLESTARRMSDAMGFTRPWSGVELIDSEISVTPVVAAAAPGSPAEAAGVMVGERLVSVAGNNVATAENARQWLATFSPGSTVALGLAGPAGDRTVELRMGTTPTVVGPADPDRLYSVVWGMAAAAVGRLDARVPSWVAALNQAAVLLHAGDAAAAAELLAGVQAPTGPGLGHAMVQYWLGVALVESGEIERARAAFEQVANDPGARYLSNDGPYLAPMAAARLTALEARQRP